MFDAIIRTSLSRRGLVLLAAAAVLAAGGALAAGLRIDIFPDLDRPRVVLLTECPGLSPEEVEALVGQPVETAILGAPGVEAVRSQASQGLVVTTVEFGWETEVRVARQVVQERLTALAGALPPGVRPLMTPPTSIMGQIIHVGLSRQPGPRGGELAPVGKTGLLAERGKDDAVTVWKVVDRHDPRTWAQLPKATVTRAGDASFVIRHSSFGEAAVAFRTPEQLRMDLRTTADWVVRPRLLKERGVAEVIVLGGDRKQYQVLMNPEKLLEYGVAVPDVDRAIKANNLNASGGVTEEGQTERPVRVLGRLGPEPAKVLADLRLIPVKGGDRPVRLGQVATVAEGAAPKRGDGGVDGRDAVVVTVVRQPHSDTRDVTDRVTAAVGEVEASLTADYVATTDLFRMKDFIDRGVYYVGEALALGAGLVVIVLFLFLLNVRTTFITLTAIPLSLVVTTLVFRLVGALTGTELSVNVMTLGGIAVAMGELVDDAIVDVENIFRRLRENAALPLPGAVDSADSSFVSRQSSFRRPVFDVVYDASREVRGAVVYGTAVVVLAFLPLFALSGVEGRLFVPLGVAYIVSILASLLVSLTVTPVLSYYLLKNVGAGGGHRDGLLLRLLKWGAGYVVRFSLRHARLLLLLTWVAVGYCGWRLTTIGADFLPKFDEGSVQINVVLPAGSSLKASNDAARMIDAKLTSLRQTPTNPDGPVRHFVRRTGRAELDEHAEPVSRSEYILSMNPAAQAGRDEFLARVLKELRDEVPGVEFEADQPLSHLISHMLSGVNAQLAVKIHGDDLDQLQALALQVKAVLAELPGLTPPVIDPQETVDELHVVLRPDDLSRYGLSREYVAEYVEAAMRGEVVSQVFEGARRFDLVVKLDAAYRTDYPRLGELRIDLPDGKGQVRLKDVADLPAAAGGPNQINRENVRRRAVVRCNTTGGDLAGIAAEAERRVRARVPLPEGYFLELGGQFEAQKSATRRIALLAVLSVAGVFVVLLSLYPSWRVCLQILNAVPTAFIGGVLALVVTNQTLTVASLVGFVSLGGIAVRNGVLLVTHYVHLMTHEGMPFAPETVVRGSLERLAPVLMTALTAGIALVPLVVGGKKPGLEILYPVSTVILGGLVTSTFCEFLIHPGLFWTFTGKDAGRLK
ncbi:efflux RND transporter permease subunit [Urbifossiella limnaea]|uniref:Nickel and cobalt resistance protein CnrA n=1 Tax=Urbifossiella limnaea TaxID=2528023 RepID=A0A517XMK3_9BACT|nr:efflux RND transporter permease subunit [Urbifossiella limnaea]QDU18745.1 Nickel and cobalt resistance protein CnrA [Urbifossiella limnaea]